MVEYQLALSGPVHNSEAVFSPSQCLGRRQIFAGHFGYKPVSILVNAVVRPSLGSPIAFITIFSNSCVSLLDSVQPLRKFGVHKLLELKEEELRDENLD